MNHLLHASAGVAKRIPYPMNWLAAFHSGWITGCVLLVLPQGIPWARMAFSSGAVMGRTSGPPESIFSFGRIAMHLGLAVLYAAIMAQVVRHFRSWRALAAGGGMGLVLYLINFGVTWVVWPEFAGREGQAVFSHFVFGLFFSACYLGMVSRR